MPVYSATTIPPAIYAGDSATVWNAETVTVATASQQVAISPDQDGGIFSISVEFQFAADPSTFEIDVQVADTDTDAAYQLVLGLGQITTANASFWGRVEMSVKARFARLVLVSRTNSVALTARICR